MVFTSPRRISFFSSSYQSEHPIYAFNISECPIRLADLWLIVLFCFFLLYTSSSFLHLLFDKHSALWSFFLYLLSLPLSILSSLASFLSLWFFFALFSLSGCIYSASSLSIMDFSLSVGPLLLLKRLQKTCSVEMTGNWFSVQAWAQPAIKWEQDPSLTWNLRKLMWSELCTSRQRRAALLGVIAEYCVCGAESKFSTSARVERFVWTRSF